MHISYVKKCSTIGTKTKTIGSAYLFAGHIQLIIYSMKNQNTQLLMVCGPS